FGPTPGGSRLPNLLHGTSGPRWEGQNQGRPGSPRVRGPRAKGSPRVRGPRAKGSPRARGPRAKRVSLCLSFTL
ncbi:hypothetical protein NHX12_019481, partial [Muraenolepis orangiensis]